AGSGQYILTGSTDRTIRLFNPAPTTTTPTSPLSPSTGRLIQTYHAHGYEVLDLAVAEDNARFVSVGGDKTVFLWDVATAQTIRSYGRLGFADPEHDLKVKAVECLARDVMKRLRDDQARKDPERKKLGNPGPGPGPAKPRQGQVLPASLSSLVAMPQDSPLVPDHAALSVSAHESASAPVSSERATDEAQIDPSLLLAASADTALRASYEQPPYDSTATPY
ncbi:hypothetical protein LTR28_013396, partial [Elasticomyces elasticus]